IVGLVRMLMTRQDPRPSEENKQLAFIKTAAEVMREMVNDLLDLAKVEAGKLSVAPGEFDLDFVFGALRGMFRPLLENDTNLIFDDTSAVPRIYSDETKVLQILRNFTSNALKFTENGVVRVWAALENDKLRISVSDTGIGISPADLPGIFDEFSQVNHPLQRRVKGTGLGLPLCKKLADLLGGNIEVESEVGKGSTFTLVLPSKYEAEKRFGAAPDAIAQPKLPKLLIIDDMEIDRYLLSHLLKNGGNYDLLQAVDGPTGLDSAFRERPDMIFLDVNLPGMDGFHVLSTLKQDSVTAEIPVVIVTARTLTKEELIRLEESALAVLSKEALSAAEKITMYPGPPARIEILTDARGTNNDG
ncbi:MAG: ATP-binding protein, partial [Bryobacteraceae bacterium]